MKRPRLRLSARPFPPGELLEELAGEAFAAAPDLEEWARSTLIAPEGKLSNPDHAHLVRARIGWLWTNVDANKKGRFLLGQAERMPPMAMGKWQRGRAIFQISEWFRYSPDFLITLHAPAAAVMDDASFLALIEHELYHCAQATDEFCAPRFNHMGEPIWTMRGHDVEEFVGVVRRYGTKATQVEALVEAASKRPSIAAAEIASACGTCLRLAA